VTRRDLPLLWQYSFSNFNKYELPDRPPSAFLDSVQGHPAIEWIRGIWRHHRGDPAEVL
jgi:hypothetical protein